MANSIIANVIPDSIADQLGLKSGDRLLAVNGQEVTDIIELSFVFADDKVELLIEKTSGEQEILEIEKDYDEDLGIEFESAVFDKVKSCCNKCIFCFVDQMPGNMRESLYVKDDDFRLSFLYGNFVTLTNMSSGDMKRIRQLHLSPLYVSVHTTNGPLREKMLGNKQAGKIMKQLKTLIDDGIELHTQIVLCPGINDGKELENTIRDLYGLYPGVLSLAIVPVGLSSYRDNCYPLETFNPGEATKIIDMISKWQKHCREETGRSFVYLADEFYLKADCKIPEYEMYDDFPQLENGIGIVRNFLAEWQETEVNSTGYHEPHYLDIVCGISAEKILQSVVAGLSIPNLYVRVIPVENKFFGPNITVSGLLTGQDIINTLMSLSGPRTGVIIPGAAIRKGETVFLDDITPENISEKIGVPLQIAYSGCDLRQLLQTWR